MKGTGIWILGFFSFLAGLNAVNAVVLWANLGPEALIQPYLIGSVIGDISISIYLWISILATLIFLGGTSSKIVSELSNTKMLKDITSKVTDLQNGQTVLESLKSRLILVDANLDGVRNEVLKGLSGQGEEIKQIHVELIDIVDDKLTSIKEGMAQQLGRIENTMDIREQRDKKNLKTIMKQTGEIANIKLKLEKLENELAKTEPQLTSQSDPEEVRGIGTRLGNELRGIGITNVGELILTDPTIISEKTGASQSTVEKLQGRAQLSMVPRIKEKDIILLEELGIKTRKELANQDPIELGRKMNGIFKANFEKGKISKAEKPTIEEIDSWIKFARA